MVPLFLKRQNWKRILAWSLAGIIAALLAGGLLYAYLFGPVSPHAPATQALVSPDESLGDVAVMLERDGIARSRYVLELAFLNKAKPGRSIRPGEYTLSAGMDTWTIATTLAEPPPIAWITFPQGTRKEEMAHILQQTLGWTDAETLEWLTVDTAPAGGLAEGDYYPDVYLIPADQSPAQVAARLRGRFTDATASLAKEAAAKHLKWGDVLTLASIVEREAGKSDKPLVAGILWNRVHKGMLLQADATLQYVKGTERNWWPIVHAEDKYLKSPFNTYQHAGLPPHPIANPGLASIAAVIDPAKTSCLYYLHDANHVIHCSVNYSGQKRNVNAYLK